MMTRSDFEQLVTRVVGEIPAEFRERFENLVFVVEAVASDELLAEAGMTDHEDLLGYYRGCPLSERSHELLPSAPDMIYLFHATIEAEAFATGLPLVQVVRETVIHEVAHYFGFSEDEMERIEAMWAGGRA